MDRLLVLIFWGHEPISQIREERMSSKKDSSRSPRDTNGPVVKTGPTAGQNRSRNNDGAWRKKRSDAGDTKKKSGCFLTTAAVQFKGLPDDCRELQVMRHFRDAYLLTTVQGRQLVERYYETAPEIADRLTESDELQAVWDVILRCVASIERGDHAEAVSEYQRMFLRLETRLL